MRYAQLKLASFSSYCSRNTIQVLHSELRCLGLLAVRNSYTPLLFFLRKTTLRQVAHRDVARPHFVRSSHLPKSAIQHLCNQRLLRSFTALRHNGADVKFRPQFAFAYANANSDFTPSYAVLDYWRFATLTLRYCFSYEKQHSVKLLTGAWLDLTSFGRRTCQNPLLIEKAVFFHSFYNFIEFFF